MLIDLKGKTAVITGASRGIGRSTALTLAAEGMKLVLIARDEDALQKVSEEAGGQTILPFDFSKPEGIPELAQQIGEVDCLVNNAGTFLESDLADMSFEQLDRVLQVNLVSPFGLIRELLPALRKSKGRIVNVVSTSAIQGYAQQSAYCASKAGLLGMMRALAIEEKPNGVRIHNVCPGGVDTDFINQTNLGKRLAGQVMISPDDIGGMIGFLLQQPDNIDISEMVIRRFNP